MDRFSETDPMNYAARKQGDDWQDEADDDTGCTARGHHHLPTTAPDFRRETVRVEVRRAAMRGLGSEMKKQSRGGL
jgi:hypothetical protein